MKTAKIFAISIILLLITACATKAPFEAQKPLNKSSLVYIYVVSDISDIGTGNNDAGSYAISINNKKVLKKVREDEYTFLNLKPENMKISVTKSQILEQALNMNLKEGETYYLRVKYMGNDQFDFTNVDADIALNEIKKTGLAGSSLESVEYTLTELVTPTEKEQTNSKEEQTNSKVDEIQKAYELKKQGVLTTQEFEKLKSEILAK